VQDAESMLTEKGDQRPGVLERQPEVNIDFNGLQLSYKRIKCQRALSFRL
jgi:hypothetical protein